MKTSPIPFATLLARLTDSDGKVRQQTVNDIMRRRNERGQAFASLLMLLNDPEYRVCKTAIKALGTLNDPRAIPPLCLILHHHSHHVRLFALQTLVQLDRRQAVPHLLDALLHDPVMSVRHDVAILLGKLGDRRAVGPLIAALDDEDWQVRWVVIPALGDLKDVQAVEPIIALLGDPGSCSLAAAALGRLGDPRAVEPLISLLFSGNQTIRERESAIWALAKLGDVRAVDPLIAMLSDDHCEIRWRTASALGELGDARAVEPLITMLSDDHWLVRLNSIQTLRKLGDTRAIQPLRALLGDPDPRVIQEAGATIAQLEASM